MPKKAAPKPIPDGWSMFRMGRAWLYRYRLTLRRAADDRVFWYQKVVLPRHMHRARGDLRRLVEEEVVRNLERMLCQ